MSPDFARRSLDVEGLQASYPAGGEVSFSLPKLDLTSMGSPANTSVDVTLVHGDSDRRPRDVRRHRRRGDPSFTLPAGVSGDATIRVTAKPSGTTADLPITIEAPELSKATIDAITAPIIREGSATFVGVRVKGPDGRPTGTITVSEGDTKSRIGQAPPRLCAGARRHPTSRARQAHAHGGVLRRRHVRTRVRRGLRPRRQAQQLMRRLASALAAVTTAALISLPAFASAADVVAIAEIQGTGDYQSRWPAPRSRRAEWSPPPTRPGASTASTYQTPGTGGDVDLDTHRASDGDLRLLRRARSADVAGRRPRRGDRRGSASSTASPRSVRPPPARWTGARRRRPTPSSRAAVDFPLRRRTARELSRACCCAPQRRLHRSPTTSRPQPVRGDRPGRGRRPAAGADRTSPALAPPRSRRGQSPTTPRRLVTLDDGASTNFLSAANQGTPLPWLRPDNEVRVGAPT